MTDQTPKNGVPSEPGHPPVPPADPNAGTPLQPNPPQPTQPADQQQAQPTQPYGQQPVPGDAAPGAPGGPGGPNNPGGPGGPVPPKKGMPGWAIGLIVGGGVLFIALIVGVLFVASAIWGGISPTVSDGPAFDDPVASEEVPAEPETDTSTDSIPLSGAADFGGPPIWGTPYLSGWDMDILDQDGINSFSNHTVGCVFTTSQNVQAVDTSSSSDAADTSGLMDVLKNEVLKRSPDAVETSAGTVDLSIGIAGSKSTIEFATSRLDFSAKSNDFASVIYARSMPQSGSYMYIHLECLRSGLDGADSPLQKLTDGLAVVPAP